MLEKGRENKTGLLLRDREREREILAFYGERENGLLGIEGKTGLLGEKREDWLDDERKRGRDEILACFGERMACWNRRRNWLARERRED